MDGMTWVNLTMLNASIPDLDIDDEAGIDSNNWEKYVTK